MFHALSRTAVLTAVLLAIGIAPSFAQSAPKYTCRATVENGSTRVICSDNPDALMGKPLPLGREDVAYTKEPAAGSAKNRANFCGPNFRLAGDGTCELAP